MSLYEHNNHLSKLIKDDSYNCHTLDIKETLQKQDYITDCE